MGTLYQLLALPACFLLLGLLRGDCGGLFTALLRRLAALTGADAAAHVELMKSFSPGATCAFVDSVSRHDVVVARKKARRKGAAPASFADALAPGAHDVVVAASGIGTKWGSSASRPATAQSSGIAVDLRRGRRLVLRSVIGSP